MPTKPKKAASKSRGNSKPVILSLPGEVFVAQTPNEEDLKNSVSIDARELSQWVNHFVRPLIHVGPSARFGDIYSNITLCSETSFRKIGGTICEYKPSTQHIQFLRNFYDTYIIPYGTERLYVLAKRHNRSKMMIHILEQCQLFYLYHKILAKRFFKEFPDTMQIDGEKMVPSSLGMIMCCLRENKNSSVSHLAQACGVMYLYYQYKSNYTPKDKAIATQSVSEFVYYLYRDQEVGVLATNIEFMNSFLEVVNSYLSKKKYPFELSIRDCYTLHHFFMLQLKDITFGSGEIVIRHPFQLYVDREQPLIIMDKRSKPVYDKVKDHFSNRFLAPIVKIEDNKLSLVYFDDSIFDKVKFLKKNDEEIKWEKPVEVASTGLTQEQIRRRINNHHNEALDYLCKHHLDSYPIIYCPERRTYTNFQDTDDAFIFVIRARLERLVVVYENTKENSATYCFEVRKNRLQTLIEVINKYFSSLTLNKREHYKDFLRMVAPHVEYFDRIFHTADDWRKRIREFGNE